MAAYNTRSYQLMDGSTNVVTVPFDYILRTHVVVSVDGAVIPATSLSWTSANTIQLPQPASAYAGHTVLVQRVTPSGSPQASFTSSGLDVSDLNGNARQAIYLIQEEADALAVEAMARSAADTAEATARLAGDAVLLKALSGLPNWVPVQGAALSVRDFGARGDGVTDDSAAAQSAMDTAAILKKGVFWPAGRYRLTKRLTAANAPFIHRGDGIDVTTLVWDAASVDGGGLSAAFNSDLQFAHVSDMSINTLGKGGSALYLDYSGQVVTVGGEPVAVGRDAPRAIVERVKMYGADNVFNSGWNRGIDLVSAQIVYIDKFFFDGVIARNPGSSVNILQSEAAILFRGQGHPVGLWVVNSSINHVNYAIDAVGMEGLHVIGSDLVGVNVGVCFDDQAGSPVFGRPHCVVMGGHINANTIAVQIINGTEFLIQGNDIYLCSDTDHAGIGVLVSGSGSRSGTIIGNNFSNSTGNNTVGGPQMMTAVQLDQCDGVFVGGNRVRKYTEGPMRGIVIGAGATRTKLDDANTFNVDPYTQATTGSKYMEVEVLDQGPNTTMPGLHVLVSKQGADQAIPPGQATALSFDTPYSSKSNNALFNPASNTALTVASHGRYRVTANVTWDQTASGIRSAVIKKGGVTIPGMPADQKPAAAGASVQHALVSAINECEQGDYFQVIVYTNTGASVVKGPSTWFSLERVSD